MLQKFSKELKLNDEKIQEFLDNEVANYKEENISDSYCSKKTYN